MAKEEAFSRGTNQWLVRLQASEKPDIDALNAIAGRAIARYIASRNLGAKGLEVRYDGALQVVTLDGIAPDRATKEGIVRCCGSVSAVSKVLDNMTVSEAIASLPTFVTVKSGDTLSKIAGEVYGDTGAHMRIFNANRQTLSNPNRIYPGQVLFVPSE